MPNPFQAYYSQRLKNVFNKLHDFDLNGDETSLHDFRVEMKKLRAVIKFLRTIYPKQKLKKAAQKVRAIFQEAGEIREYQLLQQWIAKNELASFDQHYLPQSKLLDITDEFRKRASYTKQVLKEMVEEVGKHVDATKQILAEQYVVDLHAQIEKNINGQPGTVDWHELRKLIKQWMYAVNWIEAEDNRTENDLSFYNKMQEAIGRWHDAEVIMDTLYQKQIYLSQDIKVQKDFTKASSKINQSIRYREKQVGEMLTKTPAVTH